MMKKIILIVVLTLVLSGCKKTETVTGGTEKKGVFTSIRDAVTQQLTLKCEYADTDGQTTITYIKGQMVRMMGTGKEINMQGLMKDNKFYLWSDENKQGMELDMSEMTAGGTTKMGDKPVGSIDDVITALEEKKNNCKVVTEGASLFDVPTDIKFTNTSEFLGQ